MKTLVRDLQMVRDEVRELQGAAWQASVAPHQPSHLGEADQALHYESAARWAVKRQQSLALDARLEQQRAALQVVRVRVIRVVRCMLWPPGRLTRPGVTRLPCARAVRVPLECSCRTCRRRPTR